MRTYVFIFILVLFASCAKNNAEQATEAIDIALTHLSKNECDDALEVLLKVDGQGNNPVYLQVLSSAYACKGSFDEINFISNDIASFVTTDFETISKSLATMSTSPETTVDSVAYTSIRSGINTILNSTSGSPSQIAREAKFGVRRAGDMGMQALFLNIVNFGKFLNFYGNVDSDGDKGAGSNTNSCFLNYTDVRAQAVIGSGNTGACTVTNDGHPDLSLAAGNLANAKRRLCEGLVLFTNVVDILDNIDTSGSSELEKLNEVATKINDFKTIATTAGLTTLVNTTSQSDCETLMNTASNLNDMQLLYSLIFESGLQ